MEKVIEYFSLKYWILVRTELINSFVKEFKLELISDEKKWLQSPDFFLNNELISVKNYANYDLNKIVVSSPIKGYQIIEGKSISKFYKEFCEFLSKQSDVYQFSIDIWEPIMEFRYYKNGNLIRFFEYTLNIEEQEISIDEYGELQAFENKDIELPHPENGYDDFYYPLAFMKHLGIDYYELEALLNLKCSIYRMNFSM